MKTDKQMLQKQSLSERKNKERKTRLKAAVKHMMLKQHIKSTALQKSIHEIWMQKKQIMQCLFQESTVKMKSYIIQSPQLFCSSVRSQEDGFRFSIPCLKDLTCRIKHF